MSSVKLGINIDHVATLRQARQGLNPDTITAARVVLSSGADTVIMHYRADEKHIQFSDLERIRKEVPGQIHLEIAPSPDIEKKILAIMPDSLCFVPENNTQCSEGGGLLLNENAAEIERLIHVFSEAGIETGIYCDPVPQCLRAAHNLGADTIILSTVDYSVSRGKKKQNAELEKLQLASYLVKELKMNLEAGGGLSYHNIAPVAAIPDMCRVNVGFAVLSRALFSGLAEAVAEMKSIVEG